MVVAFACGVLFGIAISTGFALVFLKQAQQPKLVPAVNPQQSEQDAYEERLARQWRNLAVYDGTDKGQEEVDR